MSEKVHPLGRWIIDKRRFTRHEQLTPCAHTRVEQEMSEKVHPSGRWITDKGGSRGTSDLRPARTRESSKKCQSRFIHRGDGLQTEAVQEAQATYSLRTHESRAGNVREGSSIGAMDHVQKASAHIISCVAADGASGKGHSAIIDVDTAALHSEKEMSEFSEALKWARASSNSEWLRTDCPWSTRDEHMA